MDRDREWERIDASLIRMRRLLETPRGRGESVDLSAVLVVDAIARRTTSGELTRIADVAAQLAVKPSTASRLVASTEATGHIERSASPDDPRSVVLTLTPSGHELNAAAKQFRIGFLSQAMPAWDNDDLATFARLLEEFSHAAAASAMHRGRPRPV